MELDDIRRKIQLVARNPRRVPYYLRRACGAARGLAVSWPEPGRVTLDKAYYFRPQAGEVLILNHSTLVSTGTERAFFNGLANARATYPYNPGYSGAGEVVMVGPGVTRFEPGSRVAARTAHSSLWLTTEDQILSIPSSVSFDQASFFLLGVIAAQGLRRGRVRLGDQVAIFGQGLIGQLTTQLAAAAGAYPITAVAKSSARRALSLASGAHRFVSLTESAEALAGLEADVVIETSGSPEAVKDALTCCRPGGRAVLLGSPRGLSQDIDFNLIRTRGLTLVGAHQSTLPAQDSIGEWWTTGQEAELYFALLAQGRLNVDALVTDHVSPWDAEWFYRRLSRGDPGILGAIFRWDQLPPRQRLLPAPLLRSLRQPSRAGGFQEPGQRLSSAPALPTWRFPMYDKDRRASDAEAGYEALRFGMIGCGEIAVANAAAVHSAPGATITMTMDVQEPVARDLASKHGVPYVTDVERLLTSDLVDAVVISVPHYLHAPLIVKAAEHGKHVIVEKPIALNVAQADDAIRACQGAGVVMSVLYCGRYQSHVQTAKELIAEGALGTFMGASVLFHTDKPAAYWSGGFTGRVETDWRAVKEKSGGGVLMSNMVHYLDIIRYLTEVEAAHVSGEYASLDSPVEVEDTIAVSIRYDNGAIGSILGSSCTRGAKSHLEIHLWGTEGSIILKNPALVKRPLEFYSVRAIAGHRPCTWHVPHDLALVDERKIFVTRFAEAVRSGKPPDVSGSDARAIQAIVDAVYLSGERKQAVAVAC